MKRLLKFEEKSMLKIALDFYLEKGPEKSLVANWTGSYPNNPEKSEVWWGSKEVKELLDLLNSHWPDSYLKMLRVYFDGQWDDLMDLEGLMDALTQYHQIIQEKYKEVTMEIMEAEEVAKARDKALPQKKIEPIDSREIRVGDIITLNIPDDGVPPELGDLEYFDESDEFEVMERGIIAKGSPIRYMIKSTGGAIFDWVPKEWLRLEHRTINRLADMLSRNSIAEVAAQWQFLEGEELDFELVEALRVINEKVEIIDKELARYGL